MQPAPPAAQSESNRQMLVDSDNELEVADVQAQTQTRVVDADFFNAFEDDFDESDMNLVQ